MTVLDESLPELDSHTVEFLEDPNQLLGRGPGDRIAVARGRVGKEFFGYETVGEIFRDDRLQPRSPQFYIDKGVEGGPILDYLVDGNLSLTWPENHDRLRPLLMKGFRPNRIKEARENIRGIVRGVVEAIPDDGQLDLVTEMSHHISIRSIATFIGIPVEDVPQFEHATVELRLLGQEPFWPGVPRLETALETVREYSERIVELRRTTPQADLISDLIAERDRGGDEAISEAEIVWNVAGILLAGHDTTRYQIASLIRSVADNNLWQELRSDRSLIPAAVLESQRLHPATPRQVRVAHEDLTVDGVELHEGDVITMNMSGAGRDPAFFTDPDVMRLDRENRFDIGFGYGFRYCLGFAVAKAELEITLDELLDRYSDVQIGEVTIEPTGVIAGPAHIHATFSR
ncbi:cytochrome P450 [Microbacterium sp. A588]